MRGVLQSPALAGRDPPQAGGGSKHSRGNAAQIEGNPHPALSLGKGEELNARLPATLVSRASGLGYSVFYVLRSPPVSCLLLVVCSAFLLRGVRWATPAPEAAGGINPPARILPSPVSSPPTPSQRRPSYSMGSHGIRYSVFCIRRSPPVSRPLTPLSSPPTSSQRSGPRTASGRTAFVGWGRPRADRADSSRRWIRWGTASPKRS